MARGRGNVQVSITADADGVRRGVRQAEGDLGRLEKTAHRSFSGLKTGAIAAGAAAAGGLAIGLTKSAQAAIEAERSQAQLVTQLRAAGIEYDKHAKKIDDVIQRQSKLSGLDDEDLQDAFTSIVRVVGDVNKALDLNALAMDFARAKHIEVAKAGEIVAKVAGGNTGILARYGLATKDGASATEALGMLQQKFAGQAEAYGKTTAGSLDRARVASENLGEIVGSKLTPLLAKAATALVGVVEAVQRNWPKIQRIANTVFGAVSDAVQKVRVAVTRFVERNRDDIEAIIKAMRNLGRAVKAVFEDVVLPIIRRVLPAMKTMFSGWITAVRGVVRIITGILTGNFGKAWDGVKDVFRGGIKSVLGTLRAATGPFREAGSRLGDAIGNGVKAAVNGVLSVARGLVNSIIDVINVLPGINIGHVGGGGKGTGLSGFAQTIGNTAKKTVQTRASGGKITAPTVIMGEEAPRHPEWVIATNPAYRQRNVGLWMQAGQDLGMLQFAKGGLLSGIGNAAKDVFNASPAGRIADAVGGINLPANPFKGVWKGLGSYILDRVAGAIGSLGGGGGGGIGGLIHGAKSVVGGSLPTALRVAQMFGLRISSTYRDPARNAAVGGVPNSLHTHGSPTNPGAVDLVGSPAAMAKAMAWARSHLNLKELLVHDVGSGLHLHMGFFRQGGKYSLDALRGLWAQAGGNPSIASLMGHIALAESGGDPNAYNPSGATGLWQILGALVPGNLRDPLVNARNAVAKYRSQGLGAWAASRAAWGQYAGLRDAPGSVTAASGDGRSSRAKATKAAERATLTQNRRLASKQNTRNRGLASAQASGVAAAGAALNARNETAILAYYRKVTGRDPTDEPPGPLDFADRDIALAELNGDPAAFKSALQRKQGILQGNLTTALGTPDPRDEIPIIDELKGLNDQIAGLSTAVEDNTDTMQQQNDLQKQQIDELRKRLGTSEAQGRATVQILADLVSGQIGGRVGLASSSAGTAGMAARY